MVQKQKMTTKIPSYKIWLFTILCLFSIALIFWVNKNNSSKTIYSNIELPTTEEEFEPNSPEEMDGWNNITTKENDTLSKIFKSLEISQKTLQIILKNNPYIKNLTNIKPNQQIQFLIRDNILEKMIFPLNTTEFLIIEKENDRYTSTIKESTIEVHEDFLTATVHGSLYATAKKMKIPYKLIQQMTNIFEWEIDFTKDIHDGDQFSILYKSFYVKDNKVNTGEIIAVEYKTKKHLHQAVAHTDKNGDISYYTPTGESLKKAFSRYPIKFSHISSNFSKARKHPILNYVRPHKGVDLAARLGTPIRATGSGRIQLIGLNNGYGNMIKIVHNKTYTSIYAHLLKFQKGLSKGDYVKRGQIIGFVGQSGLATSPHCHYEFHINQEAKNPTTVNLPKAESVPINEIAKFKFKANQLMASLNLYTTSNLAKAKTNQETNTG